MQIIAAHTGQRTGTGERPQGHRLALDLGVECHRKLDVQQAAASSG